MNSSSGEILGLHTGKVLPLGPSGEPSAIRKPRVDQAMLGPLGFDSGEQADLKNHGGTDKAINFYPHEDYLWWNGVLEAGADRLSSTSAFGENITTIGLLQTEICIGDRFAIGEAVIEVSQGRQPCWKLNHLFGDQNIVKRMTQSAKCGFYARAIRNGLVRDTDTIFLIQRPHPEWTIDRAFRLLFGEGGNVDDLKSLIEIERLATSWREKVMARL